MPYTILIVDYDAQWRKLIAGLLQVRGYKVLQADQAISARLLAGKSHVHLAIVDHRIPDIDSWITWLSEVDNNTTVVFTSSFNCDTELMHILKDTLSVSSVVQKPIKALPFIALIDKVIQDSTVTASDIGQPLNQDGVQTSFINSTKASGIFNSDSFMDHEDDVVDLGELRQEYVECLKDRLAQMQRLVPIAAAGSLDAMQDIRAESHKLRGSAGAFGLPSLGSLMGDIEDALVANLDDFLGNPCIWRTVNFFIAKSLVILDQENGVAAEKADAEHKVMHELEAQRFEHAQLLPKFWRN